MRRERQVLLIDADDTLWEENLHFEQAIDAFVALVSPLGYPPDHVRRTLDVTERRNILQRGYGAWSFALTLEEVYLELAGERADEAHVEEIRRVARLLHDCPVGGLLLFNGGPQTKAALDRLQSVSKVPLLVAADIEFARLAYCSDVPP